MQTPTDIKDIANWLNTGSVNVFGRPFSGKDTQGKKLAEMFDGTLLGGGDILRGSNMPPHIKTAMKTGKLIPTKDYIDIVLPFLSKTEFFDKPLILSSVGRWIGEEEGVMQAAKESGHPIKAVIYLNISEQTVHDRWQALHELNDRGERHDDTPEILDIRLQEFREKTLPVIEKYRELGLLIDIDGDQTPEQVYEDIQTALANLVSASQ
jgi:adenylate kinase family enzyme